MHLLCVMNSSPAHLTWITTAILRSHATQASDDKQYCNPHFVLYEFLILNIDIFSLIVLSSSCRTNTQYRTPIPSFQQNFWYTNWLVLKRLHPKPINHIIGHVYRSYVYLCTDIMFMTAACMPACVSFRVIRKEWLTCHGISIYSWAGLMNWAL